MIFTNILASAAPNVKADQSEPNMAAIVLGNLAADFLLALIFERWAGIRTFVSGAIAGGAVGWVLKAD